VGHIQRYPLKERVCKGIGLFIADKLNALGIYTFDQVSNMTPKIEEEVN
jgi:predicted flap endonuclease-1-like 5' DNA nuclease